MKDMLRLRFWGAVIALCASIVSVGYFASAAVTSGVMIYGQLYPLVTTSTADAPQRIAVGSGGFLGCDRAVSINSTGSNVEQIANVGTSKFVYICHIHLVSATANNVALVEGIGTVCGTNTTGLAGGATAATGWNFAANGGLALGNGGSAFIKTGAVGKSVCLFPSGAGQVSGSIWYSVR